MFSLYTLLVVIFFFKQKTAYEMRISDWSSDVCSSDLLLSIESRDLGCDIRVKAVIGEPFAIAVDGNAMRRSGQPHAVGCLSVNDFRRNFVSNEDGALRRRARGDRDGAGFSCHRNVIA